MDIYVFLEKYLQKTDLLLVAEEIELQKHLGLAGVWNRYITVDDLINKINKLLKEYAKKQKDFPYPELIDLPPSGFEKIIKKVMNNKIKLNVTAWGEEEKERRRAKKIVDLIFETFGRTLEELEKKELIDLLMTNSNFTLDALPRSVSLESEDLLRMAGDLAINYSDLDLKDEEYLDSDLWTGSGSWADLWERIIARVQPELFTFNYCFNKQKNDFVSPNHLRRWQSALLAKARDYSLSETIPLPKVQMELEDFQKYLESRDKYSEANYFDIRYLFQWVQTLTKSLVKLNQELTKIKKKSKGN